MLGKCYIVMLAIGFWWRIGMGQNSVVSRWVNEGLITAVSFGCILIILGAVALLTPNVVGQSDAFFKDFNPTSYTLGSSTINLPAPLHPAEHAAIYTAILYFFIGVAILELVLLPLRLAVKSPIRRIAGTVGAIVFWIGAAFAADYFLLSGTVQGWFNFWAILIMFIGVSLIARFAVYAAKPRRQHNQQF
jgi:uncharacterized membrane protein YfcA